MAITLQHQLTVAGIGPILQLATGTAAVTVLTQTQANATSTMPSEAETAASTLALFDSHNVLLHPSLHGVKAINIGTGLGLKRQLLSVPRYDMNPTKRRVMTLLTKAKNSQALHSVRSPIAAAAGNFTNPLQPLSLYTLLPAVNGTIDANLKK